MERVNQIDIEKIMNIKNVQDNLILSSLYISSFEMLVLATRDSVRDFFKVSSKEGQVLDNTYNEDVKKLDNHILTASCMWLEKMGAITADEVKEIVEIRRHRNYIAHEMPRLLIDRSFEVNINYLVRIKELIDKIDSWWAKNELSIIGKEYNSGVMSGRMLILDHVFGAVVEHLEKK